MGKTYSKVAIRGLSAGQRAADLSRSGLDRCLDALLLEFDRHRGGFDAGLGRGEV